MSDQQLMTMTLGVCLGIWIAIAVYFGAQVMNDYRAKRFTK